jgi:hypothetical protein
MSVLLLVLCGVVMLSLSRSAPQRQLWRRALQPAVAAVLRLAGLGCLLCAALWAAQSMGWVIGLALWCGSVTVWAALWTFSLPWLARRLYNRRI